MAHRFTPCGACRSAASGLEAEVGVNHPVTSEPSGADRSDPEREPGDAAPDSAAAYFRQCHERVPAFVAAHFSLPGALSLHRHALGRDLLIAPVNFLLGIPNFLLQLLALAFGVLRLNRASRALSRVRLGFTSNVQRTLRRHLERELLALPAPACSDPGSLPRRVLLAAEQPLKSYLHARNAMADLAAGTIALALGAVVFRQFTPGSVSTAAAIAQAAEQREAIQDFLLGDSLGALYYATFPPEVDGVTLLLTYLLVGVAIAFLTAFAGLLHDPLQRALGIHRRRLHRLLGIIEASAAASTRGDYRPRSFFLARVYDAVDWIKGWLSL